VPAEASSISVQGSGFRVQGLGFKVQGSGFCSIYVHLQRRAARRRRARVCRGGGTARRWRALRRGSAGGSCCARYVIVWRPLKPLRRSHTAPRSTHRQRRWHTGCLASWKLTRDQTPTRSTTKRKQGTCSATTQGQATSTKQRASNKHAPKELVHQLRGLPKHRLKKPLPKHRLKKPYIEPTNADKYDCIANPMLLALTRLRNPKP